MDWIVQEDKTKRQMSGSEQSLGERIYLHPSGLSKARRKIFESWILKEGGILVVAGKSPKQGE